MVVHTLILINVMKLNKKYSICALLLRVYFTTQRRSEWIGRTSEMMSADFNEILRDERHWRTRDDSVKNFIFRLFQLEMEYWAFLAITRLLFNL